MENFDDQLNQSKSALDKNPEDFNANFEVGKVYYDEGERYLTMGAKTTSNEQQQSLVSSGNKMMEESMPYFEKAHNVKPDDKQVVSKLQSVYSQLNISDKIKGINERIDD